MATETITRTICDICGAEGAAFVTFDFDGPKGLDLCKKDLAAYQKALKSFALAAHPVRTARASKVASRGSKGQSVDSVRIREWAIENGFEIGTRGRIPLDIQEAYARAN